MGGRSTSFAVVVVLLTGALAGCSDSSSGPSEAETEALVGSFVLDPLETYLHTCRNAGDPYYDDGALDAVPMLLDDYGLAPGDSIRIEVVGSYNNGIALADMVVAVFSSSGTLLGPGALDRVPDAIEAGIDYDSGTTWGRGHEINDIPEDFACTPEVSVRIPAGATHVFVNAEDSYYEDNRDDDGDFGFKIWKYR